MALGVYTGFGFNASSTSLYAASLPPSVPLDQQVYGVRELTIGEIFGKHVLRPLITLAQTLGTYIVSVV